MNYAQQKKLEMLEHERLKKEYPHSWNWIHADEGGDLSWDQYSRMRDWCNEHIGPGEWLETSDPIGVSSTFWIKDANHAALFKLTFVNV